MVWHRDNNDGAQPDDPSSEGRGRRPNHSMEVSYESKNPQVPLIQKLKANMRLDIPN